MTHSLFTVYCLPFTPTSPRPRGCSLAKLREQAAFSTALAAALTGLILATWYMCLPQVRAEVLHELALFLGLLEALSRRQGHAAECSSPTSETFMKGAISAA